MSKEEPRLYTGIEGITCVFDWRTAPTDRVPAPPAPKKKTQLSKRQQSINALDTPEEQKQKQKQKRDMRHYKNSVSFDPTPQKSADRNQRIKRGGI